MVSGMHCAESSLGIISAEAASEYLSSTEPRAVLTGQRLRLRVHRWYTVGEQTSRCTMYDTARCGSCNPACSAGIEIPAKRLVQISEHAISQRSSRVISRLTYAHTVVAAHRLAECRCISAGFKDSSFADPAFAQATLARAVDFCTRFLVSALCFRLSEIWDLFWMVLQMIRQLQASIRKDERRERECEPRVGRQHCAFNVSF